MESPLYKYLVPKHLLLVVKSSEKRIEMALLCNVQQRDKKYTLMSSVFRPVWQRALLVLKIGGSGVP